MGGKLPTMNSADLSALLQVVAAVVGIVISILVFSYTKLQEAKARQVEAAKPFLELRQRLYLDTLKVAAVLADPENHGLQEIEAAKKRFRELYIVELSMVEAPKVEAMMVALALLIAPELTRFTPPQQAAYDLSHAIRDSFSANYNLRR